MLPEGTILEDHYKLEQIVGIGGTAIVYRAIDMRNDHPVAIKMLRDEYQSDAEFAIRFKREADAASKVSHENIVNLLDAGTCENRQFIVMEYIDGITLKEKIKQEGKIEPSEATRIIIRILAALDHAHKHGIVHRDIKPQNILVDKSGHIKVADFGIARLKADPATQLDQNTSAEALGSVHYFSPEQAKGVVADEKSDLYSVGIVFYEMLTGQVPFEGEKAVAIALKHINEKPASMLTIDPSIPKSLDEIVLHALEKDPGCRYQSATEMMQDLRKSIRHPNGGIVIPSPRVIARVVKTPVKKHTFLLSLLVALLLCFICTALIWYFNMVYDTHIMPDLTGLTPEQAKVTLTDSGFSNFVFSEAYSDSVAEGLVCGQNKTPLARVKSKAEITVLLSIGSEWYELPDLTGQNVADVKQYLYQNNITTSSIEYVFSDLEEGTVLSQLPAAGIVSLRSPITLYVSGPHVLVPAVTGIRLSDATTVLKKEGLEVGTVTYTYSPDYERGFVFAQSVIPETEVLAGTTIDLTVCGSENTYYPRSDLELDLEKQCVVTVVAVTPTQHEAQLFESELAAGKQTIKLSSDESGRHILRVYFDGTLYKTYTADFE